MAGNIYIDCTNTLYEGDNTGIQRVVNNITSRCQCASGGLNFIPVFASYGKFYRFVSNHRKPLFLTRMITLFMGNIRNFIDLIFDIFSSSTIDTGGSLSLTGALKAGSVHANIVFTSRRMIPFILRLFLGIDMLLLKNIEEIEFVSGDTLFLPDVFWNTVLIDALKKNEAKNITKILLIHDVFPYLYPELVDNVTIDSFMEHLPYVFAWADGVMSVSRSSLHDIRKYGESIGLTPEYDFFHLGADFSGTKDTTAVIRPLVTQIFAGSATYLMVGTIEPRKNHRYVLEVFKNLWRRGEKVNLCIVGKIGWKCQEIIEEIKHSPYNNSQLFMINDANDAELEFCYSQAKATILASFAEGFGLPLVEAMRFGKLVFASDIPVFREMGGDIPLFFSLDSYDSLIDLILVKHKRAYSASGTLPVVRSWDDAVEDLFSKIIAMAGVIRSKKPPCQPTTHLVSHE